MRVVVMGNNRVAWECVRVLREQGCDIVGLVLHPEEKRRFGEELTAAAGVPVEAVFPGDRLREPAVQEALRALGADVALSLLFDYILRPGILEIFPLGIVNLHPSYLPYNRGQYPNVWSIVEGTPAGVTLHYVDEGIDTGDIIAQREVPVLASDTGKTLYERLEAASVELFREVWPAVVAGEAPRRPQPRGGGTYHRSADADRLDHIDLDREYRARDLINILRARTFPPYSGAYFIDGDRKVHMRLELLPAEDIGQER